MLALGEEYGGKVWTLLDDDELRQITIVMSRLGTVESSAVEDLLLEFVSRLSASGALMGNYEATERLLRKYLAPDRVSARDGRCARAGRPQHVGKAFQRSGGGARQLPQERIPADHRRRAVASCRPDQAAKILAILPEELALDVVNRMLRMEAVQKNVVEHIEKTLRKEFMSQPVANAAARRARGDGGHFQRLRPPDRSALHGRARRRQLATAPSASRT